MKAYLIVAAISLLGSCLLLRAEQTPYGKLNAEAVQLYTEGKYAEAVTKGEEALKLAEQTLAPDDKDLIVILENLAAGYGAAKMPDKAQSTYERILAMKEKDVSITPASKANTLFNLGDLELDQTNWAGAASYFQRCLEIREKATGPDSPDTILTIGRLAWIYQSQKKYAEEVPLLERAATGWAKAKGPEATELGLTYYNLGFASEKLKKKPDAERYYKQSLAIRQKHPGEKDADLINTLFALATFYRLDGKLMSAEPLYKQLLTLQDKNLGKDDPAILSTLRGYLEVVGPDGLQKRNVADTLTKRIHRLETAEGTKDESPKGPKTSY
jgi:tetratricopeptide (TPR) repeat protein